jgi:hypothetical protein
MRRGKDRIRKIFISISFEHSVIFMKIVFFFHAADNIILTAEGRSVVCLYNYQAVATSFHNLTCNVTDQIRT